LHNIRVGIAQINSTVGDLTGNTKKIMEYIDQAKSLGIDLLTFPELAITGYPPEDLLLKPQFIKQNKKSLNNIIEQTYAGATVLINISASPYHDGKGLFRERMLATRASDSAAIVVHNNLVGGQDELIFDGNSLIINEKGEIVVRGKQFEEDFVVADLDVESVFRSQLRDPRRRKETPWVKEKLERATRIDVPSEYPSITKPPLPPRRVDRLDELAEIYQALVLGVKDYVHKNGFEKVVIGLSGGVDSSLVAAIAVDALGAENVIGVAMPSRYSSPGSKSDAEALARNLGIEFRVIPIEKAFSAYLETLAGPFKDTKPDSTEENIQARIRGNLLFALSNKFGWLVLACSNKSETVMGYTTLYGDMSGGLIPLKDVPKTLVVELARYRNHQAGREIIPSAVLTKAPSAELRPNQKDTDTLPPYDILDPILKAYVEDDVTIDQIIAMGFDRETVSKVAKLVDRNEYKRRQAAPGIKITPRDFGRDRRLPITNKFREE